VNQSKLDGAFGDDPIRWYLDARERARSLEAFDVTRTALATASPTGEPDVRFVLVKIVDARGFTFFTNYESNKGLQLAANARAALATHWHTIGIQVRVNGSVQKISSEESDAYFAARPRESQLGAWASDQSRTIDGRAALDQRLIDVNSRFAQAANVPRPEHWGGYRVSPATVEIWQDRVGRLHDRWLFTRVSDTWQRARLQP
jgi:pyridoxamine 5'-phosphate oxidase